MKRIYARITIPKEVLEASWDRDMALQRRMMRGGLSAKLRRKAWNRIQGHRFYINVLEPEMRGLINDLKYRGGF